MFYKLPLFLIIIFFGVNANANILKNIDSFTATFKQNITNSSNSTIVYEGEIFIKEDNQTKILWRYKTPIIKDVYIVDKKVIIDEPELEQATYTNLKNNISMLDILKGAKQISSNIYKATLEGVEYTIIEKDNILEIHYEDELENKVVIYFENIKKNQTIKNIVFEFKLPANYDILKQ